MVWDVRCCGEDTEKVQKCFTRAVGGMEYIRGSETESKNSLAT